MGPGWRNSRRIVPAGDQGVEAAWAFGDAEIFVLKKSTRGNWWLTGWLRLVKVSRFINFGKMAPFSQFMSTTINISSRWWQLKYFQFTDILTFEPCFSSHRGIYRNSKFRSTRWWFQTCFNFHPYLGKWSKLTSIFFRWVGSTTNQLIVG